MAAGRYQWRRSVSMAAAPFRRVLRALFLVAVLLLVAGQSQLEQPPASGIGAATPAAGSFPTSSDVALDEGGDPADSAVVAPVLTSPVADSTRITAPQPPPGRRPPPPVGSGRSSTAPPQPDSSTAGGVRAPSSAETGGSSSSSSGGSTTAAASPSPPISQAQQAPRDLSGAPPCDWTSSVPDSERCGDGLACIPSLATPEEGVCVGVPAGGFYIGANTSVPVTYFPLTGGELASWPYASQVSPEISDCSEGCKGGGGGALL